MCGEIFWKRITIFCLAFGLGFFVTNVFGLKEASIKYVPDFITSAPQKENCVPVDENLKYHNLKEKTEISKDDLDKIEAEKIKSNGEPQLFIPEKDSVELKTLLHKEKCYDSNEQK